MAEISFTHVGKIYPDGTRALRDLNLEVAHGEFMVFVGPSGCGKTTALRMVAGLEDVSEGAIGIGGDVVNEMPSKQRDVAMVFQSYALYPHMSVAENLGFSLKLRRLKKREIAKRVVETARVLDLEALLDRKPRQLSGGQRQRVAMGRAIVREPRAFLMDEPLSNLDAKLRVQMRAEIARIQHELNVTTIYVTHDQVEAMTMGDRVAVMKTAELQQVDRPERLYQRPANLFVAGFIGSPAMNMVGADLIRKNGSLHARFGTHELEVDTEAYGSRPALARYEGRRVILGIRPEAIEDASLASGTPEQRRLHVVPELREALGAETLLHFSIDAPPVLTRDTLELARDVDDSAVGDLDRGRAKTQTRFVARVDPRSRASEGEAVELVVDTRALHFFDPETDDAIEA
jgi:multiple sugar transport system ATP-binding protein